jgi:dihydropteroate synthase
LQLLGALQSFTKWNRPLMLGASRKSFLRAFEAPAEGRMAASLACACWGVARGTNIVRAHDVESTRQALRLTEALLAQTPNHENS